MTEPKRLLQALDAGFELSLLEAATEPPSAKVRARALEGALSVALASSVVAGEATAATVASQLTGSAVGGAGHASAASVTAQAGGVLAKAHTLGLLKALAIGATVGGGLAGGGLVAQDVLSSPTVENVPTVIATPPSVAAPAVQPSTPVGVTVEPVDDAPVVAPTLRGTPAVASAPRGAALPESETRELRLQAEVAALDVARTALARGDSAGALSALEHHRRQFPRGVLAPEASVLRIEALARSGQGGHARALAEAFLKQQPSGPLAERARRHIPPP